LFSKQLRLYILNLSFHVSATLTLSSTRLAQLSCNKNVSWLLNYPQKDSRKWYEACWHDNDI